MLCGYCQQNVSLQLYNQHVTECVTKTKACPSCSKNIMVKNYEGHVNRCKEGQLPRLPPEIIRTSQTQVMKASNVESSRLGMNPINNVPPQVPINQVY